MIDFLEEWTNTAQIGKHSLDGSYPETGGMVNLPSGSDRVITYYVANPQNYDLGIEVTFDPNLPGWDPIRTSNHPDFSTTSNQGTVEQDPIDKSIIRLTLNENALASLDGTGSTLSGNGEFPMSNLSDDSPYGGAVYIKNGTFTMKGGTINGNKARFGGAVYVDGGFFAMTGGTISTNSAFLGGGVFVRAGSFTMSGTDAKIRGNASSPVQGGGVGEGGGVFVSGGSFNMSDGVISENRAYLGAGAGIYINGGSVSVSGGSIDNNSADTVGGGVCISFGNVEISGSVTIQDNMLLGSEFKGTELYIGAENLTISGGVIQNGVYSMSMGIPSYAIYSEKTFAMTGSPTITDCAITLEQGAHIDVQGLSTDAALTNLQISPTTYTAGEALLEHATDIAICKKFGLYSPPADGIWWIGLENGNGVLKTIEGTYDESTNTITVPTMPDTKDELQNTVNGSAESGVKVEITGGGNIDIDSTVSVPGGADVAIKPDTGNSIGINASGDTKARRFFGCRDGAGTDPHSFP